MKVLWLIAWILSCLGLLGCGAEQPPSQSSAPAQSTTPSVVQLPSSNAVQSKAFTPFQPFGMAVCDEYVQAINDCFASTKLDAGSLSVLRPGYEQSIAQWRRMSESENLRSGVVAVCQAQLDAMPEMKKGMRCE